MKIKTKPQFVITEKEMLLLSAMRELLKSEEEGEEDDEDASIYEIAAEAGLNLMSIGGIVSTLRKKGIIQVKKEVVDSMRIETFLSFNDNYLN